MDLRRALVREPGDRFPDCISNHPLKKTIDVGLAREQHSTYQETLRELGMEVIALPRDDLHPDSCFVEDTAVVFGKKALICRPERESRRGETDAVESFIREYLATRRAVAPATVEGGDILHFENRLVSGITRRTNRMGVSQMGSWLGVKVDTIEDPKIMHLKSYVSCLGRNTVVATATYAEHPALASCDVLAIPDKDWYSANSLVVGDTVIMPEGYPGTESIVREAGFEVIRMNMSEFPKCEGALTCLSILF